MYGSYSASILLFHAFYHFNFAMNFFGKFFEFIFCNFFCQINEFLSNFYPVFVFFQIRLFLFQFSFFTVDFLFASILNFTIVWFLMDLISSILFCQFMLFMNINTTKFSNFITSIIHFCMNFQMMIFPCTTLSCWLLWYLIYIQKLTDSTGTIVIFWKTNTIILSPFWRE